MNLLSMSLDYENVFLCSARASQWYRLTQFGNVSVVCWNLCIVSLRDANFHDELVQKHVG